MLTTTTRTNKYAGTCATCTGNVPAGEGLLGSKVNGRWTTYHTTCPRTPAMPRLSPSMSAWLARNPELAPSTSGCGTTGCEAHDGECIDNWGREPF